MRVDQIDKAYRVGFDRTSDAIEMIPESGDPFGADICELIGIVTAGLLAIGERRGTDQKEALKLIRNLL